MKGLFKTSLLFTVLAFLMCFGIPALSYGQAVVSVDPAESRSPGVGQQLTIQLKITNGQNITGYEVSVNFDTSALRHVSSANGNYLPSGAFFAPPRVSGGTVTLTATSVSGAASSSSGTLASVTFSVVAVKASTLRLTTVTLSDSNARPVSVTTRNGAVVEGGAAWDINGDGIVNVLDLTLVAQRLGTRNAQVDTNGDGLVNVLDLVLVAQHLGETVGTPTPPPVPVTPVTQPTVPQPVPQQPPAPEGMVLIPAGEFEIGSNDAEAFKSEQPVRTVYVDAFYMDETEVTNVQYKEFLLENPQWQKGRVNAEFADGFYLRPWNGNNYPTGKDNHPVTYVSWSAAMAYAQWADKRLPTEAEWEYAARGGLAGKKYPNGNTITPRDANYSSSNVKDTTPVAKYPKNGYGLYDMAGNVREWCLDELDPEFYFTFPRNGVARNPLSGANSVQWLMNNFTNAVGRRSIRGTAFSDTTARITIRASAPTSSSIYYVGFRCVKDVVP